MTAPDGATAMLSRALVRFAARSGLDLRPLEHGRSCILGVLRGQIQYLLKVGRNGCHVGGPLRTAG